MDERLRRALRKAVRDAIARGILPDVRAVPGPIDIGDGPRVITRRADGIYILGER
jgi:hypothetical protein